MYILCVHMTSTVAKPCWLRTPAAADRAARKDSEVFWGNFCCPAPAFVVYRLSVFTTRALLTSLSQSLTAVVVSDYVKSHFFVALVGRPLLRWQ